MYHFVVRSSDYLLDTISRFKKSHQYVDGFSVTNVEYLDEEYNIFNYHHFIFTSQYAVKGLIRAYDTVNFQEKYAYCIGEHTARHAKCLNFKKIYTAPLSNSKSLIKCILNSGYSHNNFLYCAGKYRKSTLEFLLNQCEIDFEIMELYTAEAVIKLPQDIITKIKELRTHKIAFICFSMRTATICYNLLKKSNIMLENVEWHIVGNDNTFSFNGDLYYYQTPYALYSYFL